MKVRHNPSRHHNRDAVTCIKGGRLGVGVLHRNIKPGNANMTTTTDRQTMRILGYIVPNMSKIGG
jgi:hypothetical protein